MVGDNHKGICESVSEKYGYWAVAANFWGSSLITVIESTQIINADELCRKLTEYQKQKLKKQLRRRAVIEPVTGRLKEDFRLSGNFLKGIKGDDMNVLLAAAYTVRKWIRNIFGQIFNSIFSIVNEIKSTLKIILSLTKYVES